MILGGNISHITLEIINIAKNNNVILLCLPPHNFAFLQPLDRGVFKDVIDKSKYVVFRISKTKKISATIYKDNFPLLMRKVTAKISKVKVLCQVSS